MTVTTTDVRAWPSVSDVVHQTHYSPACIMQLIHAGELDAVQTRVGWLVNPESVADFMADRAMRKAAKEQAEQE
jgi:2,4-dienoyl-CoA reductase-like NADH-dependent reductase (Old Yellow Enzyme family)